MSQSESSPATAPALPAIAPAPYDYSAPVPAEQRLPSEVLLNGGKEIEVTLIDGTKKTVKVRLVKLSEAMKFYEVIGDLSQFVDFITGNEGGFCDSLDDDSAYAVDKLGKDLNDFRCARFLARQKATRQALSEQAGRIVSQS